MRRSQEGIGLILALIILALLSLLVGAMLTAVTVEVWVADNYRTETQLVYLTEAGIEEGRHTLRRTTALAPSSAPFIKDIPLLDTTGRETGRYSVSLLRSDPITLRSVGTIGPARKTIEVRLKRSGFPPLFEAIMLNEDTPLPDGADPRLEAPESLERIVDAIRRNATDVYDPEIGSTTRLGAVGSASDYRTVLVNGDCELGDGTGYGILLVRGELSLNGTLSWNGLILVIGQGVVRASPATTAWISGAVFVTRTRDGDRTAVKPLGTLRERRGVITFDAPPGSLAIDYSPAEVDRANREFPLAVTTYREY